MLTLPEDFNEFLASHLCNIAANPKANLASFGLIKNLFLDLRIYYLEDEELVEDAWDLEMATLAENVERVPDYIYDFVHFSPDPDVKMGWLLFCRRMRCVSMSSSVKQFLSDHNLQIAAKAQQVFAELTVKRDVPLEDIIGSAGFLSMETVKNILSDHLFPDGIKRKAIDWLWSYDEYSQLSGMQKKAFEEKRQSLLREALPLLIENFEQPFVGGPLFNLHLDYVISQVKPIREAVIEGKKNKLLYWWWPDATANFASSIANLPEKQGESGRSFLRELLASEFYRLGKLIVRDTLNRSIT